MTFEYDYFPDNVLIFLVTAIFNRDFRFTTFSPFISERVKLRQDRCINVISWFNFIILSAYSLADDKDR